MIRYLVEVPWLLATGMLCYLVIRYEAALTRISHYHGESVEELINYLPTRHGG